MRRRRGLQIAGAAALILAAGFTIPKAAAQTTDMAATEAVANAWWFHGYLEAGGRFFVNNPQKNGVNSLGGNSLAKYYEYSDIRPGPFGNFHLATGTKNGLYQVDTWGDNVGYNDQRFELNASKVGEIYFNFLWDETPHVYSDSATTIYNGIGTNHLTLPPGLSALLNGPTDCNNANPCANRTKTQQDIQANLHQTDIGIRRDTAAFQFRWTPDAAWDIRADYSYLHRYGTQVDGVVFSPGTSGVVSQVTKPVDDVTHNFGLNGEFQGSSPWGQMFTFKLGYQGSVYQDAFDSYQVDNPFCAGGPNCARTGSVSKPTALMSLWPDNQANGFDATLGAELPLKSRYMGTMAYTMMRQNANFIPFTVASNVITGGIPALPYASLNGAIDTFLSNNVLTTQLTPELKSKLGYRYYNFDNRTPELNFTDWVLTDSQRASTAPIYAPVNSISISYTKQNADADLNWRPDRTWNLGVAYGYERYDWTRADVDSTNENSGKVYVDYKPWVWLTLRASALYSQRRYGNYDYFGYVGLFQWPTVTATRYSPAMRQFYLDNRDRAKGQFSFSIDVVRGLTVSPVFGFQDDVYDFGPGLVGFTRNQAWRAGVDVAFVVDPRTTLLFSYMNEQYAQNLRSTTATNTGALTAANTYNTDIRDTVNTFVGTVNFAAIPNTLDLKLSYALSLAKDSQPVVFDNGTLPATANGGQYPDVKTTWQRLDFEAKYTFDKQTVQNLGLQGEMFAKLFYVWESNRMANWQNDIMQNYMASFNANYGYMTWLAYDNPNYNVHLIGLSLAFKW